jgi:hypothetical protein
MSDSRTIGTGIRWTIVALCVALADVLLYFRFGFRDESTLLAVALFVGFYGWVFLLSK